MAFDVKKFIAEHRVVFPVVTGKPSLSEGRTLKNIVFDRLTDLEDLIGRSGKVTLHPKEVPNRKDEWDVIMKQLKIIKQIVNRIKDE